MRFLTLVICFVAFHPLLMWAKDLVLVEKLSKATITRLEFRQANAVDVLELLVNHAAAWPPIAPPSIGLIQTNPPEAEARAYVLEIEDGTPFVLPALTIYYERISVLEAINRVTRQLGLTYQLSDDGIELFTRDGKRILRTKKVEQGDPPDSSPASGSEPDDR